MTRSFALRQVAFATRDLKAAEEQLIGVGGWTSVGQDRHAETFDLTSHIFRRGSAFVEILVPTSESTTLTRFLDKHADRPVVPYMLLLQDMDPNSSAYDSIPQEWRVHDTKRPGYHSMQLSPKAVPPLLIAVAQSKTTNTWPLTETLIGCELAPGAPTYREVHLQASDPEKIARQWTLLLDAPVRQTCDEFVVDGPMLTVRVRGAATGPTLTGLSIRGSLDGGSNLFAGLELRGES